MLLSGEGDGTRTASMATTMVLKTACTVGMAVLITALLRGPTSDNRYEDLSVTWYIFNGKDLGPEFATLGYL